MSLCSDSGGLVLHYHKQSEPPPKGLPKRDPGVADLRVPTRPRLIVRARPSSTAWTPGSRDFNPGAPPVPTAGGGQLVFRKGGCALPSDGPGAPAGRSAPRTRRRGTAGWSPGPRRCPSKGPPGGGRPSRGGRRAWWPVRLGLRAGGGGFPVAARGGGGAS
jgi:hypothetical protein